MTISYLRIYYLQDRHISHFKINIKLIQLKSDAFFFFLPYNEIGNYFNILQSLLIQFYFYVVKFKSLFSSS